MRDDGEVGRGDPSVVDQRCRVGAGCGCGQVGQAVCVAAGAAFGVVRGTGVDGLPLGGFPEAAACGLGGGFVAALGGGLCAEGDRDWRVCQAEEFGELGRQSWASRTSGPGRWSHSSWRAAHRCRNSLPFSWLVGVISKNKVSWSSGWVSATFARYSTSLIQPCISIPPCGPVLASTSRRTICGPRRMSSCAIIPPIENPSRSIRVSPSASVNAMTSRAISVMGARNGPRRQADPGVVHSDNLAARGEGAEQQRIPVIQVAAKMLQHHQRQHARRASAEPAVRVPQSSLLIA